MKKKQLSNKTNAVRLLEKQKILYNSYEFDWNQEHLDAVSVAHQLSVNPERVFKTLVTTGNRTGTIVAVIPGNNELDLKKLARISKNKKIELLPVNDLEKTTGYIRGGCSPIGMKKSFPIYLSQEAVSFEKIIVSGGKRGLQIELTPHDLLKITKGVISDLTVNKQSE
ncbi:Cys-tRNA(Pro) deacylase [Melissococcus plutonius]|uniref:Cys-tRNA(Pro)/Cys-tRNA(Cys) deacylase n=2 Tax=Melissococcus plutonius TaxID=33970 RepID=F3YAU3_MELPT|nr:Cys-tRNA(Pro) deacylase [Melissococcus plutonius]BAL62028.1 transcriptional regulator [Melissococcus plutonius DAT561]AIM25074.1 putative Cys-tRNA(Pro)/Cys-tRNA(Cys) deacylase EbsC [Melissococcus plutonius S1]KMT25305.1 putative Cys-tRNA(Pro)/Cys-tRNA(Cys) deacylase EbsC [Melissococcus plutonius]KMT26210.1 putative Cys-tRNA(Pro)/Cys-tRNA(Cys) deacylase EbsC [Melissococcus plutonius]KMT26940.1 putative Cys-tRNA(Pro)/Cys-tRNA(Cys) deacylase EbsC [Melissococcus plutonius]